jgi:hypothetical protein
MNHDKTYIRHIKTETFFNEHLASWIQDFWALQDDSTLVEHALFDYKTFVIKSRYHETPFHIMRIKEESRKDEQWFNLHGQKALPDAIQYGDFYLFLKNDSTYLLACNNLRPDDIIEHVKQYNENWANNLMLAWQGYIFQNSYETHSVADNMHMNQKSLINYLVRNGVERIAGEVNFNIENEEEVEAWFDKQDIIHDKKFRAFNDLDYTPFLMNGKYVIHDSSSAMYFIYYPESGLDASNGTWYTVSSSTVTHKYQDNWNEQEHDALSEAWSYAHIWDAKAIEMAPHPWRMAAQFKDGQLVTAGEDFDRINLLQSYICAQLEAEDQLTYEVDEEVNLDLDYKVRCGRYTNYRTYRAVNRAIAFFEYINHLRYHDDKDYPASHLFNMDFAYQSPQRLSAWEAQHPDVTVDDVLKMTPEHQGYMNNYFGNVNFRGSDLKHLSDKEKIELLAYAEKYVKPFAELDFLPNAKQQFDALVSFLHIEPDNGYHYGTQNKKKPF